MKRNQLCTKSFRLNHLIVEPVVKSWSYFCSIFFSKYHAAPPVDKIRHYPLINYLEIDSNEKSGTLHNSNIEEQPNSVKEDLRLKPKVTLFKRKSCLICSKKHKTKTALAKQCDSSWHQYATKSIWER